MDITKMSVLELEALAHRTFRQLEVLQRDYQIILAQIEKKSEVKEPENDPLE